MTIDYFDDNVEKVEDSKREFEYLNEIMNEMISQEITQMLHDDDIYLFDKKEESKIRFTSSYENYRILVQDFYNEYRSDIIQSRLTGNMDILFQKVGKDNFFALNQLVHEYAFRFSGLEFYMMHQDRTNNIQSDRVLFHDSCLERSKDIYLRMNQNYLEYLNTCSQSR